MGREEKDFLISLLSMASHLPDGTVGKEQLVDTIEARLDKLAVAQRRDADGEAGDDYP